MADILKKAKESKPEEEIKNKPGPEPEPKKEEPAPESTSAEIAPAFKKTGKEDDIRPPVEGERSAVSLSSVLKNEIKAAASSAEVSALYDETVNLIKELMEGTEAAQKTSAKIKNIIISIEKFVNYQILNNDGVLESVSLSDRRKNLYNSPINVSLLSIEIGIGQGFERADLIKLGAAAVMHDIEMIKFSSIYRQSRRLSVKEYGKMISASLSVAKIMERFIDVYKTTIAAAPQESSQIDKTKVENLTILESARSCANFRGYQARVKYAEGFKSLRVLKDI